MTPESRTRLIDWIDRGALERPSSSSSQPRPLCYVDNVYILLFIRRRWCLSGSPYVYTPHPYHVSLYGYHDHKAYSKEVHYHHHHHFLMFLYMCIIAGTSRNLISRVLRTYMNVLFRGVQRGMFYMYIYKTFVVQRN